MYANPCGQECSWLRIGVRSDQRAAGMACGYWDTTLTNKKSRTSTTGLGSSKRGKHGRAGAWPSDGS